MNTETGKEEVHAGERKEPKRQQVIRFLIYLAGMVILAIGITLNTKTGLGVSPIISIAYCVSSILDWNFGNTTMGLYCVFGDTWTDLPRKADRNRDRNTGSHAGGRPCGGIV